MWFLKKKKKVCACGSPSRAQFPAHRITDVFDFDLLLPLPISSLLPPSQQTKPIQASCDIEIRKLTDQYIPHFLDPMLAPNRPILDPPNPENKLSIQYTIGMCAVPQWLRPF